MFRIALLAVFLFLSGCASLREGGDKPPVQPVKQVDLKRYMGTWYEISRYPNRFQASCESDVRAEYTLMSDGEVLVVNSCNEGVGRPRKVSKGKAWVVDASSGAKLKVSFMWPFSGDYWIIDLGESYEYAVIATPNRNYLWVLSRDKKIDARKYVEVLQRIRSQGFDPNLLVETRL